MLTLRALGTSGSQAIGQFIRSEPYRYEVIGLPTGSGAMLARLSGVWKILRIERGKYRAWSGSLSALKMPSHRLMAAKPTDCELCNDCKSKQTRPEAPTANPLYS